MVHAELVHQNLAVVGGGEEGERHSDEAVEVAPRGMAAPRGAHGGGEHLLGGGLADGARHRQDEPVGTLRAPGAGKAQKKLLAVIVGRAQEGATERRELLELGAGRLPGGHDRSRPEPRRLDEVGVAVDALAGKGNEHAPLGCGARVAHHLSRHLAATLEDKARTGCLGDSSWAHPKHLALPRSLASRP